MLQALQDRINAGRVAVQAQFDFFQKHFGQVPSDWKEDNTRVTFADFAISERIFHRLRRDFPNDAFCSEEANPADEILEVDAGYAWVLDPIDGTNNYALGLPFCAIGLALLWEGWPVYGFVYDYARRLLVEGGPGHGVLDGRRKATPIADPLDARSIIGLHLPLPPELAKRLLPWLTRYRMRSLGSGTLNLTYTAVGLLHGSLDTAVRVWDIAAPYALLLGGGGEARFLGPTPFPLRHFHARLPVLGYCAGGPTFLAEVSQLLDLPPLNPPPGLAAEAPQLVPSDAAGG